MFNVKINLRRVKRTTQGGITPIVARIFPKNLFALTSAVFVLIISSIALAVCTDQPDAPDCVCFDSTGDWDAGGPGATLPIQEVALDTLGTKESCHTAAPVDDDCGKPYYQLTLGMNTVAGALTASYVLSEGGSTSFPSRQEWCSETVSYWHREAGIPYTLGYRNAWHEDWRNYSVPQMRTWYEQEEENDDRGRWIESGEVDYGIATLGVTLPTPGAYMAIMCMNPNPSASWCDPAVIDRNHSLMVDEMWIHRDGEGKVFRVEATFLEGNSGRQVKNSRRLDDLLSLTTRGSQWFSYNNGSDGLAGTADDWGVKIYGFGIALDASGNAIYDNGRLHYVDHPYMRRVMASARPVVDTTWNTFYISIADKLTTYTNALRAHGGPVITCSADEVKAEKAPNGQGESWIFPQSLKDKEVVVEFDFLNKNPLKIHGLMLLWNAGFIPSNYRVFYGPDKEHYLEASLLDLAGLQPPQGSTPIPEMVNFPTGQTNIRFVKFVFPQQTFTQMATLTEMIVNYDHGPSEDTSEVPQDIPLFVDVKPGTCPNVVLASASDNILIALLGSGNISAGGIDTATLQLNGHSVAAQSFAYQDVTTPFIGTDPGCHEEHGDGVVDLVLNYKTADVIAALGLKERRGEIVPIVVTGLLNSNYANQPFVGQDFIQIPGPAGDVDGDGTVDLKDVIIGLKVLAGSGLSDVTTDGDVDADLRIGLAEIFFDLKEISENND
jgi:hypothetical protein